MTKQGLIDPHLESITRLGQFYPLLKHHPASLSREESRHRGARVTRYIEEFLARLCLELSVAGVVRFGKLYPATPETIIEPFYHLALRLYSETLHLLVPTRIVYPLMEPFQTRLSALPQSQGSSDEAVVAFIAARFLAESRFTAHHRLCVQSVHRCDRTEAIRELFDGSFPFVTSVTTEHAEAPLAMLLSSPLLARVSAYARREVPSDNSQAHLSRAHLACTLQLHFQLPSLLSALELQPGARFSLEPQRSSAATPIGLSVRTKVKVAPLPGTLHLQQPRKVIDLPISLQPCGPGRFLIQRQEQNSMSSFRRLNDGNQCH